MTWSQPANQQSPRWRVVFLGVAGLIVGCAAMESTPPERLAELRAKAQACSEALPDITQYDVDRFGRVSASAQGPDSGLIQRNFSDCVAARGRWTTWTPGQPPPMLEPLGSDSPDPNPALRVP